MEKDTTVIDELNKIQQKDKDGLLKPRAVINAARNENHPLHDRFEWDDAIAGEAYRLEQARDLIVSVRFIAPDNEPMPIYTSLASDRIGKGGGYRRMDRVISDTVLRAEMLATALKELENMEIRYKRLKELKPVFDARDKIAKRAKK